MTVSERRASDRALALLRGEIIAGRLAPGAVLAEIELADRLRMSRTPVRTALAGLTAEGLAVAVGPRRLEVAPLRREDVAAAYELRGALEPAAASLAARRGDPAVFEALAARLAAIRVDPAGSEQQDTYELAAELDREIDRAIASPRLQAALDSARHHAARIRRAARDHPARLAAAADEHRTIADAISRGDAQLAADAVRIHLHHSLEHALATLPHDDPEPRRTP
ncbi:GntR family transcriptional regulator [Homoserinibacter sp. YIM 151385]|uniref:GntR family transcriptional regulator n=1 Tax=Homoserinibacter sp. YIM 151385 TaxID=2985506 RepID=UPI0022EFF6E9|nr:GntR family transcriptional regulator [Homoserinibacter sp. YIM 151385]WBU37443.1 GntR family transcriptional regulator [Homoserinibacter sp. YIM 151385]